LHVSFGTGDGTKSEGWCEFEILRGLKEKLILGIPDILTKFKELFVQMIQGAEVNFIRQLDGEIGETLDPWKEEMMTAEEEGMIPEIELGLCFLEVTHEEALKEYFEVLPSRVSEELRDGTAVMELLCGVGAESFNPKEWKGIRMEPAVFEFDEDMPKEIKPYRSKVPHGLEGPYEKEMQRLTKYLYEPSNSSIASPVVVAKKATKPFIRLVGDYRRVNKFCRVPKHQIPDVIEELHKLASFDVYHDLDFTNAYHQVPIARETARKLSLQTVSPAAMVLNAVMQEIFRDFLDWMVVIYDNMLVLCKGYHDALVKLELVLERCRERNLFLSSRSQGLVSRRWNSSGMYAEGGHTVCQMKGWHR
jgi:hypothetical protein